MLREGEFVHRFSKGESRNFLKAAEASLTLAERRGVWHRCRHFTFVFRGQRLVSVGLNSPKTHPRNLLYRYVGRGEVDIAGVVGTHSEMSAVMRLEGENPRGLVLVNTRVNRRGVLDNSMPCPGCADMIRRMGFRRVFHTVKGGGFARMEF